MPAEQVFEARKRRVERVMLKAEIWPRDGGWIAAVALKPVVVAIAAFGSTPAEACERLETRLLERLDKAMSWKKGETELESAVFEWFRKVPA